MKSKWTGGRLSLLAALWLAALVLAVPSASWAGKNVILMIGDGMNAYHEIAASRYLTGQDWGLAFHNNVDYMTNVTTWDVTTYDAYAHEFGASSYSEDGFNPQVGYASDAMGSASAPIVPYDPALMDPYYQDKLLGSKPAATDSASSATAMYTGQKTNDGRIAWSRNGVPSQPIETIGEKVRNELGGAYGIVSTVQYNHATPAALVAHNPSRNNYAAIADEIINLTQPDVVIGSGFSGTRYTSTAQRAQAAAQFEYVEKTAGVDGSAAIQAAADRAVASGSKLFGLFGNGGGNWESPVPSDSPGSPGVSRGDVENPTLAAASVAALDVLKQNDNGFYLSIEQGDIDWANHARDFSRMIGTMWDLNEAYQAVVDYINQPGDNVDWSNTLLIVTSDHSNSYMRLYDALGAGDLPSQTAVGVDAYGPVYTSASYDPNYVSYGMGEHTNEPVRLYAKGAGAGNLRAYEGAWNPGMIDDTHIFEAARDFLGVSGN